MAHDLNYNENLKRHSMVSVKEVPWHGLGKVVDKPLTSKECIVEAGLDYTVKKVPNAAAIPINFDYPDDEQDFVINPSSFSTIRTDNRKILGTVGRDYTVVQNSEAFEFFDDITKAKEAMFETAGALYNGERIFITAKLPNYIKVDNVDVIEQYLLFFNSHDGSSSIEVMFTPTRVVCNNTLTYARSNSQVKYKIRHTKSAKDKLDIASKILKIQNTLVEDANYIYKEMAKIKLSDDAFNKYISKLYLTDSEYELLKSGESMKNIVSTRKFNVLNDIYAFKFNGVGQDLESTKGTLWGAYNAVTGYYQHTKKYKSADDKLTSITGGDVFSKTQKAFSLALDIVNI